MEKDLDSKPCRGWREWTGLHVAVEVVTVLFEDPAADGRIPGCVVGIEAYF